jgi:hypothetical protein
MYHHLLVEYMLIENYSDKLNNRRWISIDNIWSHILIGCNPEHVWLLKSAIGSE